MLATMNSSRVLLSQSTTWQNSSRMVSLQWLITTSCRTSCMCADVLCPPTPSTTAKPTSNTARSTNFWSTNQQNSLKRYLLVRWSTTDIVGSISTCTRGSKTFWSSRTSAFRLATKIAGLCLSILPSWRLRKTKTLTTTTLILWPEK